MDGERLALDVHRKEPGKHGVYDFLSFDGYHWNVVNATHVRERPIWELLGEHGIRSVVVNVPVTHPAREFDGALIPGMTAPKTLTVTRMASSRTSKSPVATITSIHRVRPPPIGRSRGTN